jgi:hypothetical protein
LLGKARERSLLSLNRKVVNSELFPSPPHSFERLLFTPAAGNRACATGVLSVIGSSGSYWSSSSISSTGNVSSALWFSPTSVRPMDSGYLARRAVAVSVRCVQASAREVAFFNGTPRARTPAGKNYG